MARSDSTTAGASGRQTLTTTRCPERRVAACTWAMDAAANGVRSKVANNSSTPAPVTAGGEHLPEFDEGDAAIVEGKADRAGQTSAAVRGAEFGPPAASQIGEKAPALEDSHDLRVALRPTKALA